MTYAKWFPSVEVGLVAPTGVAAKEQRPDDGPETLIQTGAAHAYATPCAEFE